MIGILKGENMSFFSKVMARFSSFFSVGAVDKNVAILYVATGRYICFFDDFYASMEKNFLPGVPKTYFVWTDCEREFPDNVIKIPTRNLGWPYATLYRYKLFQQQWHKLKKFRYMFFVNANMIAVRPIGNEILPSDKQGIVVTLHPGYYKNPVDKPYDRNPRSLACISYWERKPGENYYMGGFNGGTARAFGKLIKTIARNTEIDERNGIIALWHDESHLNRYMHDRRRGLILLPEYGFPEGGIGASFATCIEFGRNYKFLIQNKANPKWGGHEFLRGQRDVPIC